MRIGIISFAHMHAYSYAQCVQSLQGVELTAVTDTDENRGRAAAERFKVEYVSTKEALFAKVDAVIVCNENVRHKEAVLAAARAGKHVLCEKPIATTVEEAAEMIRVCEEHNVKLQTAFPVRFSPPVQRVKKMIDNGDLGRILAIRGTNRGTMPGGWFLDRDLAGGGAVLDHTVHVVDLMRWFMDSEVTEVFAEVDTRFHEVDIDDCGLLMLEFDNGVFASHDPSWSRCRTFPTWGDVTMEVVGTAGAVRLDAFAQHLMLYSDKEDRVSQQPWAGSMDLGLVKDFVECIQEDRAPSISGEDGLRALEVALAAYESAQKGEAVPLGRK